MPDDESLFGFYGIYCILQLNENIKIVNISCFKFGLGVISLKTVLESCYSFRYQKYNWTVLQGTFTGTLFSWWILLKLRLDFNRILNCSTFSHGNMKHAISSL